MKKLFVAFAVVAFCFGTMSCKKDCVCVTTSSSELVPDVTITMPDKLSKSDCEALSTEITVAGFVQKTECKSE